MNDTKKGMLFIIMAAFFFASMNVFVKLSGDLSSIQKSFFRNLIAALFAFIILIKSKEGFTYQKKDIPMLLLRSTFGTLGILCNFYAVDHLLVSDASMLNKLSPFFVIIFSSLFLKEKANINCTNEQFYKMAKNKYDRYLHFTPPFRVYTISNKIYLLTGEVTSLSNICQVEENKCHCRNVILTVWSEPKTLLKIQNQFYFVNYSKFMSKTLSLTQLSNETMEEEYLQKSCMFKFTDNKGE